MKHERIPKFDDDSTFGSYRNLSRVIHHEDLDLVVQTHPDGARAKMRSSFVVAKAVLLRAYEEELSARDQLEHDRWAFGKLRPLVIPKEGPTKLSTALHRWANQLPERIANEEFGDLLEELASSEIRKRSLGVLVAMRITRILWNTITYRLIEIWKRKRAS